MFVKARKFLGMSVKGLTSEDIRGGTYMPNLIGYPHKLINLWLYGVLWLTARSL